jgi:DNA-directed RNA polymerase subunit M/transcription elongation factor TFIIS
MNNNLFCNICQNITVIKNIEIDSKFILDNSNSLEKKNKYKIICTVCKVFRYPENDIILYTSEKNNILKVNNPLMNERLMTITFNCSFCKEDKLGKLFIIDSNSLQQNIICSKCNNIFDFNYE